MNARAAIALAVAGASLACASTARTPEAPEIPDAPIRAFDIPTLEKLAQEMYAQDGLAWTATDVLFAHVNQDTAIAEGVKGWITGTRDGRDVVRFIRVTEQGPEALYDVVFPETGSPAFSDAEDRALTPDEVAQFDARALAGRSIARRCSDRYNTIALRDPESDGWLVWALAASTEPNAMVIGGHYRFTISPDGQTIRARDALSVNCLALEKKEGVFPIVSHVVSLTPLETHAFASLTYGKTFRVGTEDGRAWRVDAGRIIRVEQDSPGEDGFIARAIAGIDEQCETLVSKTGEVPKHYAPGERTKVIERTEKAKAYSLDTSPEVHVEMILCLRRDIVPSPNDYKLPAAGYPLMITDRGAGHEPRKGLLQRAGGEFRFEVIDGDPLSDAIAARVRARLEGFQRAIEATPH